MPEDKSKALQILKEGKPLTNICTDVSIFKEKTDTISNIKEIAQNKILDGIAVIQTAILDLANIAQETKHPAAYRELSTMFKTYVDANRTLIESEKTEESKSVTKNVTENHDHKHIHLPSNEVQLTTRDMLSSLRN